MILLLCGLGNALQSFWLIKWKGTIVYVVIFFFRDIVLAFL